MSEFFAVKASTVMFGAPFTPAGEKVAAVMDGLTVTRAFVDGEPVALDHPLIAAYQEAVARSGHVGVHYLLTRMADTLADTGHPVE